MINVDGVHCNLVSRWKHGVEEAIVQLQTLERPEEGHHWCTAGALLSRRIACDM